MPRIRRRPVELTEAQTEWTLAIAATFDATPLVERLSRSLAGITGSFRVQVEAPQDLKRILLNPFGSLLSNVHGLNLILIWMEDWNNFAHVAGETEVPQAYGMVEHKVSEIASAIETLPDRSQAQFCITLCPFSAEVISRPHMLEFFRKMENRLIAAAEGKDTVRVVRLYEPAERDPDQGAGNTPETSEFFDHIAAALSAKVRSLSAQQS